MRKITLLLFALLLTTVGTWAQSVKIQPSTDETTPEHVYLLVSGHDVFMDKGTGDVRGDEARGRFAFYAVDGKEGFYKIMSYDSDNEGGKWLYYENTGNGRDRVSFVQTRDGAKEWKITATTIKGGASGYQLQPCNDSGQAIGTYMNWNGGSSYTHVSAGFYSTAASGDAGSGWILVLAPMDGNEYFVQDNCGVFLNLETLGFEPNASNENKLATISSAPVKCKIKVTDSGAWKLYIAKEGTDVYLGQSSGRAWNSWVDAGQSNFNWAVETVKVEGEWHYMLKNTSGNQNGYLGCDTHANGEALYVNQSADAKKLKLRLYEGEMQQVTVKVQNNEDESPRKTVTLQLPVGSTVDLKSYISVSPLVVLESKTITVTTDITEETLTYTYNTDIPFANSYAGLGGDEPNNKWVSFFTLNGRMFVRDPQTADGDTEKNPAIDKATFTRLTDAHFWGFICTDPFAYPAIVKIVNKEVTDGKGLRLTKDQDDAPLRIVDKEGNVPSTWGTDEWVIETGRTNSEDGKTVQYYGIRANTAGKNRYINNNASKGFMTTWVQGPKDDAGSNIKFTIEQATYDVLKERALNAPCNAVHSLNSAARSAIQTSNAATVSEYKELIKEINSTVGENAETGYIDFVEDGYYFIRNYTPEGGTIYALGLENGTTVKGMTVALPGSTEEAMRSSDPNMIWKIEKNGDAPTDVPGIGMSRTIPRLLKHVNSGKYFKNVDSRTLVNSSDITANDNYYFVDLGTGQHFMKNVQYNGSGNQAQARPLTCANNGTLVKGEAIHKKNTRNAWYVIEATDLEVTIGNTGYATIYLPFGVTMPYGLTAYAVTSTDNGKATLTRVKSIPANQGAILKGEPGTTYTLTINDEINSEETPVWENNKLSGSTMDSYVEGEGYVLADGTNGVGLYRAELNKTSTGADPADGQDGTHFQNNGNKAYLKITVPGARFLSFDFDTVTGLDVISGTEPASTESVVYDLSGRRVRNAQKGLYIVNGKKVVK